MKRNGWVTRKNKKMKINDAVLEIRYNNDICTTQTRIQKCLDTDTNTHTQKKKRNHTHTHTNTTITILLLLQPVSLLWLYIFSPYYTYTYKHTITYTVHILLCFLYVPLSNIRVQRAIPFIPFIPIELKQKACHVSFLYPYFTFNPFNLITPISNSIKSHALKSLNLHFSSSNGRLLSIEVFSIIFWVRLYVRIKKEVMKMVKIRSTENIIECM